MYMNESILKSISRMPYNNCCDIILQLSKICLWYELVNFKVGTKLVRVNAHKMFLVIIIQFYYQFRSFIKQEAQICYFADAHYPDLELSNFDCNFDLCIVYS